MADLPTLSQVLSRTKVKDLVKDTMIKGIVSVTEASPLTEAFELLIKHNLLAIPCYSVKEKRYTSFIDMVDMVAYLSAVFDNVVLHKAGYADLEHRALCVSDIADLSHRNPFHTIDSNAPLKEAMVAMQRFHLHRLAVVDSDGEMIALLTQSYLIRYLHGHRFSFAKELRQTVGARRLGEKPAGSVVTVEEHEKAVDAFRLIHARGVSACGVVNSLGKLVNVLSSTDLKLIGANGEFASDLYQTLTQFLRKLPPRDVVSVVEANTFGDVLDLMARTKVHRVFVVDAQGKPTGVISGTEVMDLLLNVADRN